MFRDSCLGDWNTNPEGWNPRNDANESGGNYSALESTIGSINTGFVGMAKELDLCGIRKTAEAFGMHRANGNPLEQSPSTVIGTNEIAPLSLAVAFAGIANNGVTCSPIAIDRIVGRTAKTSHRRSRPARSRCRPRSPPACTTRMRRVMTSGTAQQSNQNTVPQVPLIGKTGTTDGAKDTWMAGASTKVATVAAVVSVTGDRNQRGTFFDSGQAATARHRMWPIVMSVAAAKYGGGEFTEAAPGRSSRSTTSPMAETAALTRATVRRTTPATVRATVGEGNGGGRQRQRRRLTR